MSALQDRQMRRAIRRAMGPEALTLVSEQARAIAQVAQSVQLLRMDLIQETQRVNRHMPALESLRSLQHRGLWGRVCWLLTGR